MGIRETVKQLLVRFYEQSYEKALKARKKEYGQWLAECEKDPVSGVKALGADRRMLNDDILLIQLGSGELSKISTAAINQYFQANAQVVIAYGDEDVKDSKTGALSDPWFKPGWSPDTFISQLYWGNVVLIRKEWLERQDEKLQKKLLTVFVQNYNRPQRLEKIYEFLVELADAAGGFEKNCGTIGHIPQVLFHGNSAEQQGKFRSLSAEAFRKEFADDNVGEKAEKENAAEKNAAESISPKVSVIIPSKDHPQILKQALDSLKKTVDDCSFEVIVVDNGSSLENRQQIEQILEQYQQQCPQVLKDSGHSEHFPVKVSYLYEPMDFNFAAMCNMGAEKAGGEFLLFLNDDVEMRHKGWMSRMVCKAGASYAGAVGMKLYYPDSRRIQHAGIVNLPMGPVHKLQFLEDDRDYYDRWNQIDRNVLAVTGACLMVHRDKYARVGEMDTRLPVAFNDVDLCFKLWEAGYHNVVLNSVSAWHHESLSRGEDESPEKLRRLLGEKEKLYRFHPKLRGVDPYYSGFLNRDGLDTRIRPGYLTAGNRIQKTVPSPVKLDTKSYRRDACLLFRIERCEPTCIHGYGVVLGDNNAWYDKALLLWKIEDEEWEPEGSIRCYRIPLNGQYRPDLAENMKDQINVALCGFWWAQVKGIPAGRYRLGMTACSKAGNSRLINWSNHVWEIPGA